MFDNKKEIGIPVPSPEGMKQVVVLMPSDVQWTEWRRKKRVQQKDLGRRNYQLESAKADDSDLNLVNAIRVKPEDAPVPEIDEYEAAFVLTRISECDVEERPERNGNGYAVKLKVMGVIETVHNMRIPSMKDIMEYERAARSTTYGAYNTQQIRINLDASKKLYDAVHESHEGYADHVPIIHKAEVVNALLQEIRSEQDEVDGEGE